MIGGHAAIRRVGEIMTAATITVSPDDTVADLLALFERHDVNGFPVVDAGGILQGIVTRLDLLRAARTETGREAPALRLLPDERVADIMRPGVLNVERDAPVGAAVDLMVEARLHSLPVVDRSSGEPELVGIVSRSDLLRVAAAPR